MTTRPKIALYWLGACGGCDQAIIDLNEELLAIAASAEVVLWPLAMDWKYDRLAALGDGEIDLTVLCGNLSNSEHLHLARLLRRKSRVLIGIGACACFGGTPGLANLLPDGEVIDWVYHRAPTVDNAGGTVPLDTFTEQGETLTLPALLPRVYALSQVIRPDYLLPGCPPPSSLVARTLTAALAGKLPPRITMAVPCTKPLCDVCPRNRTKPTRIEISAVRRPHEVEVGEDECFLARGVVCLGPATRAGCGETCLTINVPCRGCFGPVEGTGEGGTRFLAAFAALLPAATPEEIERMVSTVLDPVGCFYRFSEPVSILGARSLPPQEGG